MPFTVTMPKLSPTMEEGTLAKWRIKEGDYVKAGDVLFEVTTDKATVEHTALDAGFLRLILVPDGKEARVNEAVAVFTEKKEESIEGYRPEGVVAKVHQEEVTSMPKSVEKKEIAKAPSVSQPHFSPEPVLTSYTFEKPSRKIQGTTPASPLAKKLAKEKGIDLSTVPGTGPGGRVMSRDVDLGQPDLPVTFSRSEEPQILPGTYEEEKMTPMRRTIAERLQGSKSFIPHFYLSQGVRMEKLLDAREQLKNLGLKVSINDFIVRAAALALRQHPEINSGFNVETQSILRFKTVDISIAVNLEQGLITPIVRHADYKNLGQISAEIKHLASKAKEGKLSREEYMGGSFTISNLGMFGISEFVAIINPPQAAILAVGGVEDMAVVEGDRVVAGKVLTLTLSADHRVIDGAHGAKFLKTLQQFLENPTGLVV